MRDEFVQYYNDELGFLRTMGREFAREHPQIASGLLLETDSHRDPHVERILDAFAFLSARVRLKIDDEFPEIIEALLTVLYPHYVRPVPSMSIVQMRVDPERGKLTTGYKVPRGTLVFSAPVKSQECKFQTCYDTTLWPVQITQVSYQSPGALKPPVKGTDAVAAIRVTLEADGDLALDKLEMDSLRFFLDNRQPEVVHTLYELLANNCTDIQVRKPGRADAIRLKKESLRPVGFAEEEGLLPYPRRSFLAYRLLQEYFAFPDKYLFFELQGLRKVWAEGGFKKNAEILFLISPYEREDRKESLEIRLDKETFRLGCTPIINLFPQTCDPILLDQRKYEYPVVPDQRRRATTGVYSIEEVSSVHPSTNQVTVYEPFYAYRHSASRDTKQQFWVVNRRTGIRKDDVAELYLSIVDLGKRTVRPDADSLLIRAQCTNRDLPSQLPIGLEKGDFHLEGSPAVGRIHCLRKPTRPLYPPTGQETFWRLLSHLSLNYLSIVGEGKDAFQEILRLYNFSKEPHIENQVQGIMELASSRQFARVISEHGVSFTRGIRTEIKFDEGKFTGTGVFLFAQVLEQFLALYASLNSFSQLVVRTEQRKGVLREWPPRAGQRILL